MGGDFSIYDKANTHDKNRIGNQNYYRNKKYNDNA